jgi:hypothetical protein
MKSFERPRHAIFHQRTNTLLNQLTTQDVLLLINALEESDRKYVFVFVPALRQWVQAKELPDFHKAFHLERGIKAPGFKAQQVSGQFSNPQSVEKKSMERPAPIENPRAAPQSPVSKPVNDLDLKPSTTYSAKPTSPPQPNPRSLPQDSKNDEKTELIDDDLTDEIQLNSTGPSARPANTTKTLETAEKLKGLVGRTEDHPSLKQANAAPDLENPFGHLKRAYNREKLAPGSTLPDQNPLKALNKEAAKALREKDTLPSQWIEIKGKLINIEPITTIGFKSNIIKVDFPFILMDRSFEQTVEIPFAVKATYLKQHYNLEVYVTKISNDKNVLKINETLDYKYLKDLFHVLGVA